MTRIGQTLSTSAMEVVVLKPKEDRRIRKGHLWVFSNEVEIPPKTAKAGDLVKVTNHQGEPLGVGLYHPHSLISVRLLGPLEAAPELDDLDQVFFSQRIATAAELRQRLFDQEGCYRLVHGESDFLPGLIIDRFESCLVVQTLTQGMDQRLSTICDALEELLRPSAILERNDTSLRRYEDLPERVSVLRGADPGLITVTESGIQYKVDLLHHQKTGFFLDQKLNRLAVARYCRGQRVLDCFCNAGGFALNAAQAGASQVTGVDVSAGTLEQARENTLLNGFTQVEFVQSDVLDFLQSQARRGERHDLVILDPPSFTRSKKNVPAAKRAYRRINEAACRVVRPGGILVSSSCSFHIFEEVFSELVQEAALRAGRRLRLLEWHYQSPDHPILPAMPETKYLKLGIFQVL